MVICYKNLRDGTGREEGSGWGTHVYLWQIHVDIWQNQHNIVKLKKKKTFDKIQYSFKIKTLSKLSNAGKFSVW